MAGQGSVGRWRQDWARYCWDSQCDVSWNEGLICWTTGNVSCNVGGWLGERAKIGMMLIVV